MQNIDTSIHIWRGFQLCVAILLLVLGLLNSIFSKKKDNKISGLLCTAMSFYLFKTIFWDYVHQNDILIFFLSGSVFFFLGQLLYLYLIVYEEKSIFAFVIKHFTLPFLLFISYGIIRSFYEDFFISNAININIVAISICLAYTLYYLYLGIKQFKTNLDHALTFKARKKFKIFYYTMNIFLIYHNTSGIIELMSFKGLDFLKVINDFNNEYYINDILYKPFYIILCFYLMLYVLSQSKTFKSYFLGEKLFVSQDIIDGESIIEYRLNKFIETDKLYTDKDLKLNTLADKIGVSNAVLTEFIKNKYNINFTEYINSKRIEEFKALVENPKNNGFTILGLANESGFKSKATFYRVFKNKEGITPNEYFKSL